MNHCFVLQKGRKAVGPMCCVTHVKEPSACTYQRFLFLCKCNFRFFIYFIYRHQEIEYSWRESTSLDQSTLRGTPVESSLEQGDEITTDDDHHLNARKMSYWWGGRFFKLKNAPLHIRWFIIWQVLKNKPPNIWFYIFNSENRRAKIQWQRVRHP